MTTTPVQLPVTWVNSGYGIPSCCSRHGNPTAITKKMQFVSRPPAWSYLLLLAGALPFLIITLVTRKMATAPAWPFCTECQKRRNTRVGIGLGLLLLSAPVFAAPIALAGDSQPNGGVLALGWVVAFVLFFVGLALAARGGWLGTTGGIVSADGVWLRFADTDPSFAGQVNAALAAANAQRGATAKP